MKKLENPKKFYDDWAKTEEGNQSNWLDKNSSHYERFMSYLRLSRDYIKEDSNILDIGCGVGNLLLILPKCNKYGVDITNEYVLLARKNNPNAIIKQSDIEKLLFKDKSFDIIFCTEVIEHLNNPDDLFSEIRRVLKDDGKAIISTYNHWNLRNIITLTSFTNKFCSDDHLREYNYWWLKKEIKRNNFKIKRVEVVYSGKIIKLFKVDYILNKIKLNKFLTFLIEKR